MTGVTYIQLERKKQLEDKGFDHSRDQNYRKDELIDAAIAYLLDCTPNCKTNQVCKAADVYPWQDNRTGNDIARLAKAGALIAAEIDRRLMNELSKQ